MKYLFTFLSILIATSLFSQDQNHIDSLNFCSIKYKVPTDTKAESEYQIQAKDYSMMWTYMNEQMMAANLPEQFISQMEEQMKKFKKEPMDVYLLGKKVKGYKISFKKGSGIGYQIIGYGTINEQAVMVQLSLDNDPQATSDIPEFPRRIVTLSK